VSPLSGRTHRCAPTGDSSIYAINWLALRRIVIGFLHFPDADSKIRAVQFAPAAASAAFGFVHHRGALGIQAQALPGTESGADAAGLAPVPVDVDSILRVAGIGVLTAGRIRTCFRGLNQFFFRICLSIHYSTHLRGSRRHLPRFILLPVCFCRRGFGGTLLLIKSRVPPNSFLSPPLTRGCASENCAAG
jgi:hypothetical protein